MTDWKDFELECLDWLKQQFGSLAKFELLGGSNSNVSDIKVTSKNGISFYIEVKSPTSQCSQFVLIPDEVNKKFEYGHRNKLEMNPFTQSLVEYMNSNFELFSSPTTAGIKLITNLTQAIGHIRYQHMVKEVEFFITKNNLGYILIPLSLFGYYFDTEANYRRKKSGSHSISKKDDVEMFSWIEQNYNIQCFRQGRKTYAPFEKDLINEEFQIEGKRFLFKESDQQGCMELRCLATTDNPTIIFTIHIKNDVKGLPKDYFRDFLELLNK